VPFLGPWVETGLGPHVIIIPCQPIQLRGEHQRDREVVPVSTFTHLLERLGITELSQRRRPFREDAGNVRYDKLAILPPTPSPNTPLPQAGTIAFHSSPPPSQTDRVQYHPDPGAGSAHMRAILRLGKEIAELPSSATAHTLSMVDG
jgi:hypothetical protein